MLMMLDQWGNYLLLWRAEWTREAFIGACKAREGTYCAELAGRIYDTLHSDLVDLKRQHAEYYADEFSDFRGYLRDRYDFEEGLLNDVLSMEGYQILGYGSTLSGGDGSLGSLLLSQKGVDLVNAVLKELGKAS